VLGALGCSCKVVSQQVHLDVLRPGEAARRLHQRGLPLEAVAPLEEPGAQADVQILAVERPYRQLLLARIRVEYGLVPLLALLEGIMPSLILSVTGGTAGTVVGCDRGACASEYMRSGFDVGAPNPGC
jgi:hypothetical protein